MIIAKIESDGTVISTSRPKAVNVGEGEALIQYPKGIFVGGSKWTDAELNAIGYARFEEIAVPSTKRSTGHTDTFENGRVTRTHTMIDYVAPVIPDPQPTKVAVEGDRIVDPADPTSLLPAVVGETIPNLDYDHVKLRQNVYPAIDELIVALWEDAVEGRPAAKVALEAARQAIKIRFPAA